MSRTAQIGLALMGIAIIALAFGYARSHAVPPGQPPLTFLNQNNLSDFHAAFDNASSRTRLVLLLSPT